MSFLYLGWVMGCRSFSHAVRERKNAFGATPQPLTDRRSSPHARSVQIKFQKHHSAWKVRSARRHRPDTKKDTQTGVFFVSGVGDGSRTHDLQGHNLAL